MFIEIDKCQVYNNIISSLHNIDCLCSIYFNYLLPGNIIVADKLSLVIHQLISLIQR